jgi:hypothetical protein
MPGREDLIDAKRRLYVELLKMQPDQATDSDLELMTALMKDAGIQRILDKRLKERSGPCPTNQ